MTTRHTAVQRVSVSGCGDWLSARLSDRAGPRLAASIAQIEILA